MSREPAGRLFIGKSDRFSLLYCFRAERLPGWACHAFPPTLFFRLENENHENSDCRLASLCGVGEDRLL